MNFVFVREAHKETELEQHPSHVWLTTGSHQIINDHTISFAT